MNNSDSLTLVNVNADNIVKSFSILLPSKRKEIELKQKEKEERLEAERRAEAARLEAERQAEAARLEYEAKKKKVYITIILSTAILILFVFLGIKLYHIIDIFFKYLLPFNTYWTIRKNNRVAYFYLKKP